jgi:hypothetical protein
MNAQKCTGIFILFSIFLLFCPVDSQAVCNADSDCSQGQFCWNDLCRTGSGTACVDSSSCPQGEFCAAGKCVTGCSIHCDCPQGQYCYYGQCLYDPDYLIYCCSKPGCIPGALCFDASSNKSTCAEDPGYTCQNACDCGPAHCCKYSATVQHNVCVKDLDDLFLPGGTEIGPSCVLGQDATYCAKASTCDPAWFAYSSIGQADDFRSFDPIAGMILDYCTGKSCFSAGDCGPGENCVDTRTGSTAKPGASCSAEGGFCKGSAVTRALYNWPLSELIPPCSSGALFGITCDAGWVPGGTYAVQRIVATAGICGNGKCEATETAKTCPQDCSCGDGVCDSTEVGFCVADCGTCGDGVCGPFETHKNCPADCPVICGDGSCDAGEVTTCPQDCGCPASPTYADAPIWCGDGVCQAIGDIHENHVNCKLDCAISLSTALSTTSVCDGLSTQATFTYVVTNNTGTYSVSGSVADNFGAIASFSSLASGASVTLTRSTTINAATTITATASGTFNDPKSKTASALARATVTAHACDTTPPTINLACPGTVNLNAAAYVSVNVSDEGSGVASQTATNGNNIVNTSSVGSKTFTVTATDNAGNTGSSSCTYQVIYDFLGAGGFSPPIADLPAVNTAKAGQTIAVKWQLPDGKGGYISDLSAVTSITFQQLECSDLSAGLTSEVPADTSGGSGLHYDASANQFVYNWKTSSTMTGKCYVLTLKLKDGRQYQAVFSLK